MIDEGPKNKAERLAVAASIAPGLRQRASEAKSRRVKVVDKDGKVVRLATLAEVQTSLLAANRIEIELEPGIRPKSVMCRKCGRGVVVGRCGPLPSVCRRCASCATCGSKLSTEVMSPRKVRRRNGKPPQCKRCSGRVKMRQKPAEARSRASRKSIGKLTPAERTERVRKATDAAAKSRASTKAGEGSK